MSLSYCRPVMRHYLDKHVYIPETVFYYSWFYCQSFALHSQKSLKLNVQSFETQNKRCLNTFPFIEVF